MALQVRIEAGIPKLLVKINPAEADGFAGKNLGEVMLRRVASQRGHVAVLHMSQSVKMGELLLSAKLAEILGVEAGDCVEVASAPTPAQTKPLNPPAAAPRKRIPPPVPASEAADSSPAKFHFGSGLPHGADLRHRDVPPGCLRHVESSSNRSTSASAASVMEADLNSRSSSGGRSDSSGAGGFPAPQPPRPREGPTTAAPSSAAEWLRSLRAFAEKEAGGAAASGSPSKPAAPSVRRRHSSVTVESLGGNSANSLGYDPASVFAGTAEYIQYTHKSSSSRAPFFDLRPKASPGLSPGEQAAFGWDQARAPSFPSRPSPMSFMPSGIEAPSKSSPSAGSATYFSKARQHPVTDEKHQGDKKGSIRFAWAPEAAEAAATAAMASSPSPQTAAATACPGDGFRWDSAADRLSAAKEQLEKIMHDFAEPDILPDQLSHGHPYAHHPHDGRREASHPAAAASPLRLNVDLLYSEEQRGGADSLPTSEAEDIALERKLRAAVAAAVGCTQQARGWAPATSSGAPAAKQAPKGVDERRTPAGFSGSLFGDHVAGSWSSPAAQRCRQPAAGNTCARQPEAKQRLGFVAALAESLEPSPMASNSPSSSSSPRSSVTADSPGSASADELEPSLPSWRRPQHLGKAARAAWVPAPASPEAAVAAAASRSRFEPWRSEPGGGQQPSRPGGVERASFVDKAEQGWRPRRADSPDRRLPQQAASAAASAAERGETSSKPGVQPHPPPAPPPARDAGSGRSKPPLKLPLNLPIVPLAPGRGGMTPSCNAAETTRKGTTPTPTVGRRRSVSFGALQLDKEESPKCQLPDPHASAAEQCCPVPSYWRPPHGCRRGTSAASSALEKSELGNEVIGEVRRWLLGQTSGSQCSQDADWLYEEIFKKLPQEALSDAFALFGFRSLQDGDWSHVAAEEISLTYRRMCLRGHPSRGGDARHYLKLQVAMELVRAFASEGCAVDEEEERAVSGAFVLDDNTLLRELRLTVAQAEQEALNMPKDQLEEMNRALDEYILRQMCFKSEIVDEIARLHEDSAYAILGVSSSATDAEIKRAFRLIARSCHPDKGGDKEEFQELSNAYERIMAERHKDEKNKGSDEDEELFRAEERKQKAKAKESKATEEKNDKDEGAQKADQEKTEEKTAEGREGSEEQTPSDEYENSEEGSNAALLEKASKAAEEASRYAKTAAEFAHQAAEAAETARRGREQGSRDTLTKSIAHSAIVLTLTVVKAVRVVGYATLDVAAQCRLAAKRNPEASSCSDCALNAMSLGLEALNAALACAEVTETSAAELQMPSSNMQSMDPSNLAMQSAAEDGSGEGCTAAAERFVGAGVRASLAAATASNTAMSAAIAAVEGSRECIKALEAQQKSESKEGGTEKRAKKATTSAGGDCDSDEADSLHEVDLGAEDVEDKKPAKPAPTAEEVAAAAHKRLVAQRNNNHKVLQRLNAEILGHQQNVRTFLQSNRQLIPTISGEEKRKVFSLLRGYAQEALGELGVPPATAGGAPCDADRMAGFVEEAKRLQLLVPFMQKEEHQLAIPISVKARILKMAALYDLPLTMQVLQDELFCPLVAIASALAEDCSAKAGIEELVKRIQEELSTNVAETPPAPLNGSAAQQTAA
eukprot:TRINITY_DN1431_c0_g2_i4.p1 TRINITY_DN1431_c0_g2~~TRINITY_DN1431_c0_g2_i4.p1  ORF type:complete len:1618 (-),score=449.06 TRINITY_DN1431_c0_g2_i4:289-5142(-)